MEEHEDKKKSKPTQNASCRQEGQNDTLVGGSSAPPSDIDRRGFLRGAGFTALGMMGVGAFAGCSPQQQASSSRASDIDKVDKDEPFVAEETREADIVIVGLGASGFMAANIAAQKGAKVVVLEKGANYSAPNGIYASGPFAVETRVLNTKQSGTTLSVDDAFYHVMDYSHWTPNPKLMRRCLEVSKDAVAVLENIGYTFEEKTFASKLPSPPRRVDSTTLQTPARTG